MGSLQVLVLVATCVYAECALKQFRLSDLPRHLRPFRCDELTCKADCSGISSCDVDADARVRCVDNRWATPDGRVHGHCHPEFYKDYARQEFSPSVEFDVGGKTVTCERPTFSLMAQSEDQWQLPVITPETPYIRPHLLCTNLRLTTKEAIGGVRHDTHFPAFCRSLFNKLQGDNPGFFTEDRFSSSDNVVDRAFTTLDIAAPSTNIVCFKKRGEWDSCKDQTTRRHAIALNCRLFVKSISSFLD